MGPTKDYQAECDAHTLAQAREIEADGARLAKARAAAHSKATAMAKAAGMKVEDGMETEHQLSEGYRKL